MIAWMPWGIVSVIVFAGLARRRKHFSTNFASTFSIPGLNHAVFRALPVVPQLKAEEAIFSFNWLSATGTSLFLAGIASGLLLRIPPVQLLRLFLKTLARVRGPS